WIPVHRIFRAQPGKERIRIGKDLRLEQTIQAKGRSADRRKSRRLESIRGCAGAGHERRLERWLRGEANVALDFRGYTGDRGIVEQCAQGKLDLKSILDFREKLRAQQGVPAEQEKIVAGIHALDRQQLA